jgi:hypothetical protein
MGSPWRVERAERAIRSLPRTIQLEARGALKLLCRENVAPPERLWPAQRDACQALAVAYGLEARSTLAIEAAT